MINYNKNKLINEALDEYYSTFAHTLDTADFVPDKFNDKISRYIFKNMKRSFKKIDKEDKIYQKQVKKKEKHDKKEQKRKKLQEKPKKKGGFWYGIFHRKTKKNGEKVLNSTTAKGL